MSRLITNPVPRFDSIQKLEWFLLTAVTTILVIRTQLWLTHYPQLGGDGLHIAHLLYGGIFMVIAIWFGLIYLNRWSRAVTAIVGGIGFGFFIDELGKFITSDNNYFFKPAAGLIYVVFIIMFLIIRELSRRQRLIPRTALANALSLSSLEPLSGSTARKMPNVPKSCWTWPIRRTRPSRWPGRYSSTPTLLPHGHPRN